MSFPVYIGSGSEAAGTADVVPGRPTGTIPDDIWLLHVEQSAINVFGGAPTGGWTLVPSTQQRPGTAATDSGLQIFWHRAVSGDVTDPTVVDTINHTSAQIHGFRGCILTGDPWNVTSGGQSAVVGTTATITGSITTVDECLIAIFLAVGTDTTTDQFSDYTNGSLDNITERSDFMTDAGNGGGTGFATGEKATAGEYGDTTVTIATSATKSFCTIALKPPTPVAGGQPTVKRMGGVANAYSNSSQGSRVW